MFTGLTTVTQGSVGLAHAIAWFVENGYTVSIPLNDNQSYDLVVDNGLGLKRVQVKTTRHKRPGSPHYIVALQSVRHNRSENRINKFDSNNCELLFIFTEDKKKYLLSTQELTAKTHMALSQKYNQWIVA